MPMLRAGLTLAFLVASLPSTAAGQACAIPQGLLVQARAGLVSHAVGGGSTGTEWGGAVSFGSGGLSLDAGLVTTTLGASTASPMAMRATVRQPVATLAGMRVCVAGHAGGSWFTADAGSSQMLAGGLGVGLARTGAPGARLVPYLEGRALAAASTGTVLEVDVDATGLSLGIEAGATLLLGRVVAMAAGSLDGFGAGLGVTPYPSHSLRLGLGYRF